MNLAMVQDVENKCRTNTFEDSTADVVKYRLPLQSWPSETIQARISFDAVCKLKLATLTPLQQQRVSTLKKELIHTLQKQKKTTF
jgi:hypothetical protein